MSNAFDGFTPDIATLAVDYHRSPIKYRSWVLPPAELPGDAGKLLHVACGDRELLAKLSRQAEVTPSQFKTAAEFFIQQAFFARDADYYRVLGVRPSDSIEQIKEHHRLLMKLFHPDRADTEGEWTSSLATRVNQAYTVLRKPESRREYDASLRVPQAATVVIPGQQGTVKSRWARMPRSGFGASIDRLPQGVRRRFPEFVLGGIGTFAALVVGTLYLTREPPLTGTGAIGGLTVSAPANITGKRDVANSAEKLSVASRSSENIQDDKNRGIASEPAIAEPKSPAMAAPVVIAANEPATAASNAASLTFSQPEPAIASTVAAATPASAPPKQRVADGSPPAQTPAPPIVAEKPAPVAVPAQAKPSAAATPSAVPSKTDTVKPVTVASAGAAVTADGIKTAVPERTPAAKPIPPPPVPANTAVRSAPEKTAQPEAAARTKPTVPPPTESMTAKTTLASAAPAPIVLATTPVVSRPAITDLELDRLVGRFIGSYEQGDIDRFMKLFHEDAKTGDTKSDKSATRKEYASLFSSTQMRQMMLQSFRWEKGDDMVRGQGRFTARVAGQNDRRINEYSGNIRIEVANAGGVLLIKGLFHSVESHTKVPRIAESSRTAGR